MQSNDNDINKANNNDDDEDDERWDDITEVLTLIEKESVLTPTQVIAILSQNPQLPLHIVSNYILKTIQVQSTQHLTHCIAIYCLLFI